MSSWYGPWRPYVPVAKRRAKAAAYATRLAKKEKRALCPVKIEGRKIATSFWGQAWCDNLEQYSDFANRLPRGRTYARNGSVIDLVISRGKIKSIVSGSDVYRIEIEIAVLKKTLWSRLKRDCSTSIDSLLDLLQGRFDQGVMQRLTQRDDGLFPQPKEIKMRCSCPDWAGLCKHLAATLYGVGARLDSAPELLFTLRGVDHLELTNEAVGTANLNQALKGAPGAALGDAELGELFGIEIDLGPKATSTSNDDGVGLSGKDIAPKARNRKAGTLAPTRQKKKGTPIGQTVSRVVQPNRGLGRNSSSKSKSATRSLAGTKTTNKRGTTTAIASSSTKKRGS
jgi:uncharacterized Zn finger protein